VAGALPKMPQIFQYMTDFRANEAMPEMTGRSCISYVVNRRIQAIEFQTITAMANVDIETTEEDAML
jgi:hypothetical protein